MLKQYADTYKFTAKELTAENLTRLKWLTLLGLPGFPLIASIHYMDSSITKIALGVLGIVSLICFAIVMLTSFANRFWARDKYLDEWERERKHHAMSFAYQFMAYLLALPALSLFIICLLSDADFISNSDFTFSFSNLTGAVFGLMVLMIFIPHIFLLWTVKPVDIKGEVEEAEFEQTSKRNLRLWIIVGAILISGFIFGFFSAHEGGAAYDLGYNFGRWLGGVFKGG